TLPAEVQATYRCFLGPCPSATAQTFTLAPRESRAFDDMIADTFGAPNTAGGGEVDLLSGAPAAAVVGTSRLYSAPGVPAVGMFIPGVGPESAHRYGVLTQIANGGAGAGFRTNVGAFNPQDVAVSVVFALYWDGHWVGEIRRTIPAHSGAQINDVFGP